jgi:hypothetical protein
VTEQRFISAPAAAGEVIDGEAIIINLETGIYYSLDRAGASIWQLLVSGCTSAEIAELLAPAHEVPVERVYADSERLAGELAREGLLVARAGGAEPEPAPYFEPDGTYEAPRLERYTDMSDLLALDPPTPGLTDIPWRLEDGGAEGG